MAQGSADVPAVSDVHPAANVAGRRFPRFGMTVQEASVLLRCVEARRVTPGQLAVRLGSDKGMITRFIARLEDSRLIVRHVNPRDRRFSILKPTEKGKQTARDLESLFDEIRKELFASMLVTEVGELSRMMARLHKNAVDIGSAEKCEAVRQGKRIGRDATKARGPQSGYPVLPADILAPSPPRARVPTRLQFILNWTSCAPVTSLRARDRRSRGILR
jgi:DNA-binding MarR family transcriptional regulator